MRYWPRINKVPQRFWQRCGGMEGTVSSLSGCSKVFHPFMSQQERSWSPAVHCLVWGTDPASYICMCIYIYFLNVFIYLFFWVFMYCLIWFPLLWEEERLLRQAKVSYQHFEDAVQMRVQMVPEMPPLLAGVNVCCGWVLRVSTLNVCLQNVYTSTYQCVDRFTTYPESDFVFKL